MRLLKLILKANGKRGVPQGGMISPLLSNLYLNEIDKMLEKAKAFTKKKDGYIHIEYTRFSDDMVILIDSHHSWNWLMKFTMFRLKQEFEKIGVKINTEKTKIINLLKGEKFCFLGFDYRRMKTKNGKWGVRQTPKKKARTKLLEKIKGIFKSKKSQPLDRVIKLINPIMRGWVNYFRIGNSAKCFSYVKDWLQKKIRKHLMRARKRKGFGWDRWSNKWLYEKLNLYGDYKIRYYQA
jgi:RNA-directed DNA polymerase